MGNWVIPVRALYKWSSSQSVSQSQVLKTTQNNSCDTYLCIQKSFLLQKVIIAFPLSPPDRLLGILQQIDCWRSLKFRSARSIPFIFIHSTSAAPCFLPFFFHFLAPTDLLRLSGGLHFPQLVAKDKLPEAEARKGVPRHVKVLFFLRIHLYHLFLSRRKSMGE